MPTENQHHLLCYEHHTGFAVGLSGITVNQMLHIFGQLDEYPEHPRGTSIHARTHKITAPRTHNMHSGALLTYSWSMRKSVYLLLTDYDIKLYRWRAFQVSDMKQTCERSWSSFSVVCLVGEKLNSSTEINQVTENTARTSV